MEIFLIAGARPNFMKIAPMGVSRQKILDSFERIMNNGWKIGQRPRFWDGRALERIADIICSCYSKDLQ